MCSMQDPQVQLYTLRATPVGKVIGSLGLELAAGEPMGGEEVPQGNAHPRGLRTVN